MILSRMSFIPRVTGGAALRTRLDGSSDDVWWLMITMPLWAAAGLALSVGIVYICRKYDIREGLGL